MKKFVARLLAVGIVFTLSLVAVIPTLGEYHVARATGETANGKITVDFTVSWTTTTTTNRSSNKRIIESIDAWHQNSRYATGVLGGIVIEYYENMVARYYHINPAYYGNTTGFQK